MERDHYVEVSKIRDRRHAMHVSMILYNTIVVFSLQNHHGIQMPFGLMAKN